MLEQFRFASSWSHSGHLSLSKVFTTAGWEICGQWQMSKWLAGEWSFFLSSSSRNSILPLLHFLTRFINFTLILLRVYSEKNYVIPKMIPNASQNACKMPTNVSIFGELCGILAFPLLSSSYTRITRKWQKTIFSSINSESAINLQEFWINHFCFEIIFCWIVKCSEKFLNEFIWGWWESPQQLRKWLIHTEFGSWINLLVSFCMYVCVQGGEGEF